MTEQLDPTSTLKPSSFGEDFAASSGLVAETLLFLGGIFASVGNLPRIVSYNPVNVEIPRGWILSFL